MCGIAGIVAPQGFDPAALVEMTQMIDYRGPNGFGFAYASLSQRSPVEVIHNEIRAPHTARPAVGLGNRRLAILDVSAAGSQPMQTAGGRYTITYNGEIYNYKEIRQELEQTGHEFQTHTDTEVILHSYQQWGANCVDHFNGMWSFALWDQHNQQLFCARDRFGVKPFYYAVWDGKFFFASEIKQILKGAGMPRLANPRASLHFLEWGLLDYSSETFFNNIYQLQGGHTLTMRPGRSLNCEIRRYWDLPVEPEFELSDEAANEEFRRLFEKAVRLRLRSDVPVGVALSGGLDSSAVLCKAVEVAPSTEFQTFSACFTEPQIDEREYISAVLSATHAVGHPTFPQSDPFWHSLNKVLYHQDEPVGSTAAFAQWCVMAEAQSFGVPVILSGQGGDESLCGYQKYQFFYWWHLLKRGDPRVFRESFMWARQGTSSHWSLASAARYLPGFFHNPFSMVNRICTEGMQRLANDVHPELGSARTLAERQKIDLTYSSIPALLHHEDRTSMAHSIESRLPFLDYELVQFALRCAPSLKLRDGWSKWLLRSALADTLPEKIRKRRTKLGFNTPDAKWMLSGLQNGHRRLWEVPDLRMARFIDPAKFKQECAKFVNQSGGSLPAGMLFRALSLELWAHVHDVN